MIDYRPYQTDAIEKTLTAFRRYRSVAGIAPVRSGKTLIALSVANVVGGRVFVVTPRLTIAKQWVNAASEYFPNRWQTGLVAGGKKEWNKTLVAATLSSAAKHQQKILASGEWGLFIFDEAHRAGSRTGRELVGGFGGQTKAKMLFVTATPLRSDGGLLSDFIDEVAFVIDDATVLRAGATVKHKTHDIRVGGDLRRDIYDIYQAWDRKMRHFPSRQTIIFTTTKADAAFVADYWRYRGRTAQHVTSDMTNAEKQARLDSYKLGFTETLVNVQIVSEGVDVNNTQAVILIEQPSTPTPEIQRVGRALGQHHLKKEAQVFVCNRKGPVLRAHSGPFVDPAQMAYNRGPAKGLWGQMKEAFLAGWNR